MSDTKNELKPTSRRARRYSRTSVRTEKADQYTHSTDSSYPFLPNEGDDIYVKWIFNDETVWWPVFVLALDYEHTQKQSRLGFVQYHKFRQYEAERARVSFTFDSSPGARFIQQYLAMPNMSVERTLEEINHLGCTSPSTNTEVMNNLITSTPPPCPKVQKTESSNGKQTNRSRLLSLKLQSSSISKRPSTLSRQRNSARRKSFSSTHQDDNPETLQDAKQDIKQESVQTKTELQPVGNENDEQSVTINIGDTPVKCDDVKDEYVTHAEKNPAQRLTCTNLSAIKTRISVLVQRIVGSGSSSSRTLSNPSASVMASLR